MTTRAVSQLSVPTRPARDWSWQDQSATEPSAGPLAHSQEVPTQCFFLLELPKEPEQAGQRGLCGAGCLEGLGQNRQALAPELSNPPPPGMSKVQGNLKPEPRSLQQGKEAAEECLHEHACRRSVYVNLQA